MCFSAQASFAGCGGLLPAGLYCLRSAHRWNARYVPLALVPVAFAIQQAAEGVVWLGLEGNDPTLVRQGAVVFLFFGIAFWPFWVPLSLWLPESRPRQRRLLALWAALSLVWLWPYFAVLAGPPRYLSVEVVHHSIHYGLGDLPAFQVVPRPLWRLAYLVAICLPLGVGRLGASRGRWGNVAGGALVAILFVASYLFFWYAFASVWCFFAALLSLLLCYVFFQLPSQRAANAGRR